MDRIEEIALTMVIYALNTVLTLASILVLAPIAVFCAECLAAILTRRRSEALPDMNADAPTRTVLIPAHNEQLVIEQTLAAILGDGSQFVRDVGWVERSVPHQKCSNLGSWGSLRSTHPTQVPSVLVVADNCDDQTAELADRAGAEVFVRVDPEHRGKGFAMQSGLGAMRENPPEVVVVIDADCLTEPRSIEAIARLAWQTQRPVQALNLTDRHPIVGPIQAVSLLGNLFTNMIRPLGLARLGIPCRLTGTGMAFPWHLADGARVAGGSLVEDMQLGIDLALEGHLPLFCPEARVTSAMPEADRAFVTQRTRWEQGHLRTAAVQIPRLLAAAVRRRSWPLLGMALDLSVPPLTLLVALWLGAAILSLAAYSLGASVWPVLWLAASGIALAATLGLGWFRFCRRKVPLRAFAAVPVYMLRKAPIYARFLVHRQNSWVRTERSTTPTTRNVR